MKKSKSVEDFLKQHMEWASALKPLREVALSTGLEETIKWGAPVYTWNGKNIIGLGAFKSYVGVWFYQGVFLKDEAKRLINAQEGKTKALRQWRFANADEIEEDVLRSYIFEAIENQKLGKEVKPERKKGVDIPLELAGALKENLDLKEAFGNFTPGKQREFAAYISEAKRAATKISRLEKIVPMILAGIGLNDKYKK